MERRRPRGSRRIDILGDEGRSGEKWRRWKILEELKRIEVGGEYYLRSRPSQNENC